MARKSLVKRFFRFSVFCLLLFIISTTGMVLTLRVVPPVTSGLMLERHIEALLNAADYKRHYQWVPLKNISPSMGVAVIAAEDQLFANHAGFDWKAIEKAAIYNQKNSRKKTGKVRGASTISQQTAKNLFLWSGRNWLRKGLETWFTILIEALWPKDRILEVYLNIVEFGDGIYGVEAASQAYFKKPARKLGASEAALLAAVLPNPHVYKASQPSAYIRHRQQWILLNMRRLGGQHYLDTLGK